MYGYKDVKEKIVVGAIYNFAAPFKDGLARVERNGKWGFLDNKGNVAIPLQFKAAENFSQGFSPVSKKKDKWGYIDKNGIEITASKYFMAQPFSGGFAAVRLGDTWGFINKTGQEVIALKYKNVKDFSMGFAPVMNDKFKWSFIDISGKEMVAFQYDNMKPFSEGLAATNLNGKWGFLDTLGRVLSQQNLDLKQEFGVLDLFDILYKDSTNQDFRFDEVGKFSEGMVGIKLNGYWGYMNRNENIVVSPIYFEVTRDCSENQTTLVAAQLNKVDSRRRH
jgi:hypothetical protein